MKRFTKVFLPIFYLVLSIGLVADFHACDRFGVKSGFQHEATSNSGADETCCEDPAPVLKINSHHSVIRLKNSRAGINQFTSPRFQTQLKSSSAVQSFSSTTRKIKNPIYLLHRVFII